MNAPPRSAAAATAAAAQDAAREAEPAAGDASRGSRVAFQPTGTVVLHGPPPATPSRAPSAAAAFEFVRRLTLALQSGELQIPSFPDVAERVRRVLDDERASPAQVAQVVASDGALAARVLRIASAAMFNPGGRPVTELPTAIARVGHELVRCAAVAFAVAQLRAAVRAPELRPMLHEAWQQSTLVAAIAHALARATGAANADAALLTGLLHNVGRVFIAAQSHLRVAGYESPDAWDEVLNDWHPEVGRTILQRWQFPAAVADAIGAQSADALDDDATAGLHPVLVCAVALAPCVRHRERLDATLASRPAFERLGLDGERCARLLADSAAQIQQMRDALAG